MDPRSNGRPPSSAAVPKSAVSTLLRGQGGLTALSETFTRRQLSDFVLLPWTPGQGPPAETQPQSWRTR